MDLKKLYELLSKEKYPHVHIHKFIGVKTQAFLSGVAELEKAHPTAKRIAEREKNESRGGQYLALTYELEVQSADEIIAFYQFTLALPDLKIIL